MALNLTTRADYKAYAGIKSNNSDAEIDILIPKISQLVKTYCRRTFVDYWDVPLQQTFDGGYRELILSETPLVAVASVEQSIDFGVTYTALTQGVEWVKRGDCVYSTSAQGFQALVNGYRVTYTAGYEDVPNDLELAILDLITYYRKNDASVHNNKSPGGGGSVQLEYIMNTNFPAHIKRVLDLYVADYT